MTSERHHKIRERAYQLWEEGGRRHDSEREDWTRAEREFGDEAAPEAVSDASPAGKGAAPRTGRAKAKAEPDATATEAAASKASAPRRAKAAAEAPAAKPLDETSSKGSRVAKGRKTSGS